MKYLIVTAIVFIGFWLWRNNRNSAGNEERARKAPAQPAQPRLQDMVGCAICELHVPRADAVAGRKGTLYCSAEHRQRAEA